MSTSVHPTAIVDPAADLGEGVKIAPYCVIGPHVRIGPDTTIGPHVLVDGWTRIGRDCTIYKGAAIGTPAQDLSTRGERSFVEIGDHNLIREYVTIHRGTKKDSLTHIGSHTFIMAYGHVAHNCVIGDHVIITNCGTLGGYVQVEAHAVIGGMAAVHQFCRIGAYAMVAGCSGVLQDLPPYTKAVGTPCTLCGLNTVGLRRGGFSPQVRARLKRAYSVLFRSGLNTTQALQQLQQEMSDSPEILHLCQFIQTSQRGICKEKTR